MKMKRTDREGSEIVESGKKIRFIPKLLLLLVSAVLAYFINKNSKNKNSSVRAEE